MAKGLKQRLAAAMLSAAMLVTAAATPDGMSVQAAVKNGPYVSLRTVYKTLRVSETNKMTLKNNTAGWKITKIATEDRTVAMVYKKTASSFMVKGRSAGRTTVKVRLKTAQRKKHNSKLLKCKVNVVPADQTTPPEPQTPVVETKKNVATQAELDAALADSRLTEITIDTKEKTSFTIPQGSHVNTALIVKAPQADIENNATFQSVEIKEIAADTWHENAGGNTLRISASSARIVVGPRGQIKSITFAGEQAKAKLVVNGAVENVTVSAKMSLDISSDLDEKPTVPVTIDALAQGADVTAQTPLDLTVKAADTVLNFAKGSEGSKVKADARATIKNNSNGSISVADADNHVREVQKNADYVVNESVTMPKQPSIYEPGISGGSSPQMPSVTYYTVSLSGREVRVRAGEKLKESDIPPVMKRNGDGYKFSGWYYAEGTGDNIKYVRFDLDSVIDRNLTLHARYGMTAEDRILDVRGTVFVTSGSAVTVDLSRSRVTVAIFDLDEAGAAFVNMNGTAITDVTGLVQAAAKDAKLEIIIQEKENNRRFRTEIPMPEGAENGVSINLAECPWSFYEGAEKFVRSQEELNEALADRSCSKIMIVSGGAFEIRTDGDRPDLEILAAADQAVVIDNYTVLDYAMIGEASKWIEHAKTRWVSVVYGTADVVVAEGASVNGISMNRSGDGTITVNGTVGEISLQNDPNDKVPEDTKKANVMINGTCTANIPLFIMRHDTTVTTHIPLDVRIHETAPRSVVNFEAGSGNSTITTFVEFTFNNNSGQEIAVKDTGK